MNRLLLLLLVISGAGLGGIALYAVTGSFALRFGEVAASVWFIFCVSVVAFLTHRLLSASRTTKAAPTAKAYDDPLLGTLRPTEERSSWVMDPAADPRSFNFEIGGYEKPDETLLAHAQEIQQDSQSFIAEVRAFLDQSKSDFPNFYADEIDTLTIDTVSLYWLDRPNDGMIFFEGGVEGRQWRCDYVDRQPRNLGFDS